MPVLSVLFPIRLGGGSEVRSDPWELHGGLAASEMQSIQPRWVRSGQVVGICFWSCVYTKWSVEEDSAGATKGETGA
mgnify:CR=1 FL=1